MDGESIPKCNIPKTIHSMGEEFVIEINSDYSEDEPDEEEEKKSDWGAEQCDETDSMQPCTVQQSPSTESQNNDYLQATKTAKMSSPIKIGRDLEGKVNFIGLESVADDPSSDDLKNDEPSGLENIKIVNVCTLAHEFEEDTTENSGRPDPNSKQAMGPEDGVQQDPFSPTAPNMIIVKEHRSQSTLSVMLVCKFCQQLFPTHEALYYHAREHRNIEDEHSVNKHFLQQVLAEESPVNGKKGRPVQQSLPGSVEKKRRSDEQDSSEQKTIKRMKRKSHGLAVEENKCEKCGKNFMKDYQYKTHISFCKGKVTQMATCFECNKMIPAHEEYEHALKYHNVVCQICGHNLMQESRLKAHLKLVHKISDYGKVKKMSAKKTEFHVIEQSYYKTCSCGTVCGSYEEYKEHKKKHRAEKQVDIEPKEETNDDENTEQTQDDSAEIKCEKCGKTFLSSYHLESHLKRCSATAVKMTLCDICEQLVPMDEHREHVQSHRVACELCGRICMGERHLQRHHCLVKMKMKEPVRKESKMASESFYANKRKSLKKDKIRKSVLLAKNLNRKLTAEQEEFLAMEAKAKNLEEPHNSSCEVVAAEVEKNALENNADKAMSAVVEERVNIPIQHKLASENDEEDKNDKSDLITCKEEKDKDKMGSTAALSCSHIGSYPSEGNSHIPSEGNSHIPSGVGSNGSKTETNVNQHTDRSKGNRGKGKRRKKRRHLGQRRKQKSTEKKEEVPEGGDIVALALGVMERKCDEVDSCNISISQSQDSSAGGVKNARNTIRIDPVSNDISVEAKRRFRGSVTEEERNTKTQEEIKNSTSSSKLEENLAANSEIESSSEGEVPTSEPIINSSMLKCNWVIKSHLDEWLMPPSHSNNNPQAWICRHCGKQLKTREEGLNHMIKFHPTNKTTKEIVKELNRPIYMY